MSEYFIYQCHASGEIKTIACKGQTRRPDNVLAVVEAPDRSQAFQNFMLAGHLTNRATVVDETQQEMMCNPYADGHVMDLVMQQHAGMQKAQQTAFGLTCN